METEKRKQSFTVFLFFINILLPSIAGLVWFFPYAFISEKYEILVTYRELWKILFNSIWSYFQVHTLNPTSTGLFIWFSLPIKIIFSSAKMMKASLQCNSQIESNWKRKLSVLKKESDFKYWRNIFFYSWSVKLTAFSAC